MITISAGTANQRVYVPVPVPSPVSGLAFTAQNTVDLQQVVFTLRAFEVQGFLAALDVTLPEGLTPGEWEYDFMYTDADGETGHGVGLLTVLPEDEAAVVQYEAGVNYTQYDGE